MKRISGNPALTTKHTQKLLAMTERQLLTELSVQERRELQEIRQVLQESLTNDLAAMATGFTLTPASW